MLIAASPGFCYYHSLPIGELGYCGASDVRPGKESWPRVSEYTIRNMVYGMKFDGLQKRYYALLLCAVLWAVPGLAQVSDDFSAPIFNDTLWTTVDPVGDSGFSQTNGRLIISVPAGTNHDLWTSGNFGARAMKPTGNADL